MLSNTGANTPRGGAALALVALATTDFLAVLDGLLVAVALPEIQRSLGFSSTGLGWVVTAYILLFAGCLLLGGRVADLYGRRRVLLVGYLLFGVGALVGGLAPTAEVLVAGRGIQGLGAAAMTPAGLSLLTVIFPAGPARNRALGIWAAAGSVGIPAGALLGGLLSATLGWRWVLLVNVPAAVLAAALAAVVLPESRAAERHGLGAGVALTGTAGLVLLALGITQLEPLARGVPGVLGHGVVSIGVPLAAAGVMIALFVRAERRSAHPLLPGRLLKRPGILAANVVAAGLPLGLGAMMFVGTLYLQAIRGLTPWETGLAYLALAVPVVAASPVAARLVDRFGRRATAVLGFGLQTAGLLVLLVADTSSSLTAVVVPALVLTGAGAPIAYIPVTAAAVDDVGDDSGAASGLFNTTQQIANALGLAAMATAIAVGSALDSAATPDALTTIAGIRAGFLVAGLLVAGAGLAAGLLLVPRSRSREGGGHGQKVGLPSTAS